MTKPEAIAKAIQQLEETELTQTILRRGNEYRVFPLYEAAPRGWKIIDMISPFNVRSYRSRTA